MSKAFKMSILFIVAIGIIFLGGTTVKAVTTEVNNIDDLKAVFDSDKITVLGDTITITGNTSLNADINIKSGYYSVVFAENETTLELSGSIKTDGGNIIFRAQNESIWYSIIVPKGKSLKIEGGAYFGDFQNYGALEVNGGNIDMGIGNYGKLTITAGQVVSQNSGGALWNMCDIEDTTCKGELTIKGGTVGSLSVDNGTSTKILGGEIDYFTIYENASVELTGGTFSQIYPPEGQQNSESDIEEFIGTECKALYEEYTDENSSASYTNVKVASLYEWNLIKKIAPDGKNATLKTIIPKDPMEAELILSNVVNRMLNEEDYFAYAFPVDMNDMTVCNVFIQGENFNNNYEIKITYDEPEDNQVVESFISKIKEFDSENEASYYQVKDLGLINYYMTSNKSELWNKGAAARALRYSDEIIELTNGGNIKYYLDVRAGNQDESFMFESAFGEMTVFYNEYAYYNQQQGVFLKRVIYIPENTSNSKEAYIEAAQKRINDYIGTDSLVTVNFGGKLNTLETEALDKSIPLNKTDGNYYNIIVKDKTYKFYILKGTTEEIETPVYIGTDYETNIKITSTDSNVPLDTAVKATVVTSENIEKVLGTKIYKAYDIKLFSEGKDTSIEKLDNGKFLVCIPIPETFNDMDLTAFFINSTGELEEYIVDINNNKNLAVFWTNHFSTYILAEKVVENTNTTGSLEEKTVKNTNTTGSLAEKVDENTNVTGSLAEKDDTPKTGCMDNILFLLVIVSILVFGFSILKLKNV